MFSLFLSKVISAFLTPLGFCFFLLITGLVLVKMKHQKLGYYSTCGALIFLLLFSSPLLATFLSSNLERQHLPRLVEDYPAVDAIVVLGGALDGPRYPRKYLDLSDGADRVLHAFRLYQAKRAEKIIVSGGFIPFLGADMSEAYLMKSLLMDWGIPEASIMLEVESRNTYENATKTKEIADTNNFTSLLLVTSALHMPRAYKTFLKQELNIFPSPTDFLITDGESNFIFDIVPSSDSLYLTTYAVREYLGRLYYWMNGWL